MLYDQNAAPSFYLSTASYRVTEGLLAYGETVILSPSFQETPE